MNHREHLLILAAVVVLSSCASTPRTTSQTTTKPSAPPLTTSAITPPSQSKAPPSPVGSPQLGVSSVSPADGKTDAQSQTELIQKGRIKVTEAYYEETLDDVRQLIATLNTIIRNGDYRAWLTYLTPAYIAKFSDPTTLSALSESPLLQKQGIHLTSLQDYFTYVVAPSRTDALVDDVDFVSKHHVRAIAVINGQRYILYDLRFDGGSWKIGL